jgi:hypothetical protein
MKSTAELQVLNAILSDVGMVLGTSIERDWITIQSRVEREGLSFITITLPSFAKDFERSLEQGKVSQELFRPFRKVGSTRAIPAFLSGMLTHVFDSHGVVRNDASPEAVEGIRQICLAFNKLKMECKDDRKAKAILAYLRCEHDLRSFRPDTWGDVDHFDRIATLAFGPVFHALECKLQCGELKPRHGPGSVFERLTSEDKYRRKVWSSSIDRYFPADANLYCNAEDMLSATGSRKLSYSDKYDTVNGKRVKTAVRVVFVPKTMKTPRVIAIEPTYNQYCQQALARPLMEAIEQDRLVGSAIHFTDSTINGRLALEASKDMKWATLDMSEASDRVPASLAYRLVRNYPDLAGAIFSCRTKYAVLPDGTKVPLRKFASMGSALCFPMEAMVFYTVALIGMAKARNLPVTVRTITSLTRELHVFGDDLIIPRDTVDSVIETLESACFKVNRQKSFAGGYFRESCGVDAFKGYFVTPVYIRHLAPVTKRDVQEILSYVASANLFYKKGYWNTARCMRSLIERLIGALPHVRPESPVLGWTSFKGSYSIERWNNALQRFEVLGFYHKPRRSKDILEGYDRLLKFFLEANNRELTVHGHRPTGFSSSIIRNKGRLKRTWNSPF